MRLIVTAPFTASKSLWMVAKAMKLKDTCFLEEKLWQTYRQCIKKWSHHFAHKSPSSQSYGFSSSHVQMWELDYKEGWASKNWCFSTMALEKILESSLDNKEIRSSQSQRKSTLSIHWKDWYQSWSSNTLATWCKELIHWKRLWCWEKLRAGGEGGNTGWDGWMSSLTQQTWVWANSRR